MTLTRVTVRPVPLNASGRAANGVYHGIGLPLFVFDPDYGFSRFLRATSVQAAVRKAEAMFKVPVVFDPNPRQGTTVLMTPTKEKGQ